MATRKQRARKHARRVGHGSAARAQRRQALDAAPMVLTPDGLHEHMNERGFEQNERGRWVRAIKAVVARPLGHKRGPVLKRKPKRRN